MMKALEALVKADTNKTIGNHSVDFPQSEITYYTTGIKPSGKEVRERITEITREFAYHGNTICLVDDVKKKMILTHAGWYTRSTSRALNDYRAYFTAAGYQIVEEH